MRLPATTVVVLLAAAWVLFPAFPIATAADIVAAPTGVTIPKGYRNWQVVAPSQCADKDEIRVILGNNIAMKAFRAKRLPFPDGTILAKLAWKRVKSAEFDNTFVPGRCAADRVHGEEREEVRRHRRVGVRPVRQRCAGGREGARHLLALPRGERQGERLRLHAIRAVTTEARRFRQWDST